MKRRVKSIGIILAVAVLGLLLFLPQTAGVRSSAFWQRQTNPGALSASHTFLENNCAACHTPLKGVEVANCVSCHANDTALLQKQPTAFHAHIRSCTQCHIEHQGTDRRPTKMDHLALARFGLQELSEESGDGERAQARAQLLNWINQHRKFAGYESAPPTISPEEMLLDCASCHSNQDRHFNFFGQDCAQCHSATKWTIAEFQHPSPRSLSCSQCHQAPPSHYMMHFEMVDKTVANKSNSPTNPCCEDVQVNQCYRCHQTNAWNDIKGFGWYKHH